MDLRNVGILPQQYKQGHNKEDFDLNLHRRENLEFRNKIIK